MLKDTGLAAQVFVICLIKFQSFLLIYSVIDKKVFTPIRDLPTRIAQAIDYSSNSWMLFIENVTSKRKIFRKYHCWVWRVINSLYYSNRGGVVEKKEVAHHLNQIDMIDTAHPQSSTNYWRISTQHNGLHWGSVIASAYNHRPSGSVIQHFVFKSHLFLCLANQRPCMVTDYWFWIFDVWAFLWYIAIHDLVLASVWKTCERFADPVKNPMHFKTPFKGTNCLKKNMWDRPCLIQL